MRLDQSRRMFLGLLGLAAVGPRGAWSTFGDNTPLLSAYGDADQQRFGVAAPSLAAVRALTELPGRVHAVFAHPKRLQAIAIARRPGTFAASLALPDLTPIDTFSAAKGRHFYGHGLFDAAGKRLLTTENDYDGERGVIGVRDANASYRQVDEWDSGGIGPHQLVLAPDGKTLVVANGGILTHPESGRSKLNIPTMHSTLVRLDATNGALLASAQLPQEQRYLSIRHLAISASNDVVFGAQNEGPAAADSPRSLVGVWRANRELQLFDSTSLLRQGYIGSVAIDSSSRVVAASAPRDNVIAFYALDSGQLLTMFELADGCGLAPGYRDGEFWLSGGQGDLVQVQVSNANLTVSARARLPVLWDNHLSL